MAGSRRVFSFVNNGLRVGKKLSLGVMWSAKVIHARTLYHVETAKAEKNT